MELQQLRYVVAIAETGTFTRAAQRCHVVQSALSHQVAKLERELGAALFDRAARPVRLTAAGEAFLVPARAALTAADLARSEVAATVGLTRGRLRIGTVATFTAIDLFDVLRRFRSRYPQVEVSLYAARSELLVDHVREATADLALAGVTEGFALPVGVVGRQVSLDRLDLIVPAEHPAAARRDGGLRLADIVGETFADYAAGSQARAETDEAFTRAGLLRHVAYEAGHTDLLMRCVQAGLAVTLGPPGELADGLVRVPLRDPPTRSQLIVWRDPPTPAARAFLALARPD